MALHDATIRDSAITILLAANTIAGTRVRQEWIDDPTDADLPMLSVMIDSSGQSLSGAGGAPTFDVTGDLVIVAHVAEAQQPDAVRQADLLADQARSALLCSATFLGLASVRSWRVVRSFKNNAALILAETRIVLTLGWRETVEPTVADLPIFTGADIRAQTNPPIGADVII